MKKIFTILIGIVISTIAFGQNGFELTPLEIDGISAYTIDEQGNYWITGSNGGLFKYDGVNIDTIHAEIDITSIEFNDVFVDENVVYLIENNGIYYLNKADEYTFDTVVSGITRAANFVDNKLLRATASYFDPATMSIMPGFVEIYENKELILSDTIYDDMVDVKCVTLYNDTMFLGHYNGLVKYTGEDIIEVSDKNSSDLTIYNNQLWTNSGGFYSNGRFYNLEGSGRNVGVIGNQVAIINSNRITTIDYDHSVEYIMSNFYVSSYLKPFANQNGRNKMEFMTTVGLVSFNPDEYIADPGNYFTSNTNGFLDINNVKAQYSIYNSLFWDFSSSQYKVPKDGGVSSMFASGLWMGGINQNEQLRVATAKFLEYDPQFFPGPLRIDDATTDTATASDYHRMWHLDRATIENFKYRVENGEVQNGNWPVHYSIETWPAHGPEGYAENLAPFVDYNNDGVYNPFDGDYPEMKGDEMLYWIVNDNLAITNEQNMGENIGVELHCTAWANVYENGTNDTAEAINHTTFLDVKVINRSANDYHDMYLGFWTDADLGNPWDDYIATDVMNHSFYVYNADDTDEASQSSAGYGENPPAQSVTFLDAPMKNTTATADTGIFLTKFMYYVQGGSAYGDQQYAADYYNYLRGHWKDSTTLTYGGTGHDDENTLECDYMFPGDSDPYNIGTDGEVPAESNWTQETAGFEPDDQRGVGANGPFNLNAGESVNFRFAFVWARGTDGAQSSVTRLRELLPMVHDWQRTGNFPSNYNINIVPIGITETASNDLGVNIYPNPAKKIVNITCEAKNAIYQIYNLSGQIVATGRISGQFTTINISNLPNDLYLVNVNDGNKGFTKKLVVE